MDIETTGLSPEECAILEIGLIVTTPELKEVARGSWVCRPSRPAPITSIDPYVWDMHKRNGLWDEVFLVERTLAEVETAAVDFMSRYDAIYSPMAGSSVQFDRTFLKAQAPALHDKFHYRNLDVSSVRNFILMFFPEIEDSRPKLDAPHRSLGDLENSINTLRYYAEALR